MLQSVTAAQTEQQTAARGALVDRKVVKDDVVQGKGDLSFQFKADGLGDALVVGEGHRQRAQRHLISRQGRRQQVRLAGLALLRQDLQGLGGSFGIGPVALGYGNA